MSELIAYLFLALFVSFLCSLAESVLLSTPKTFLTSIKEKQSWANSFLKLKNDTSYYEKLRSNLGWHN